MLLETTPEPEAAPESRSEASTATPTVHAPAFDYGALKPEDRAAMQLAADRIRVRQGGIRKEMLAIGHELIGIKARLDHGTFGRWCQCELGIEARTAQRYMSAAKMIEALPQAARDTVSHLPPATLYRLSAASTPAEVVQEVLKAAEAGAMPSADAIEACIAKAKAKAAYAKRKAELEAKENQRAVKAAMRKGRSKEEAQELVNLRRVKAEEKAQRDRAKRDAQLAALPEQVQQLVNEHPAVMQRVADLLDQGGWHFEAVLRTLLAKSQGQPEQASTAEQASEQPSNVIHLIRDQKLLEHFPFSLDRIRRRRSNWRIRWG